MSTTQASQAPVTPTGSASGAVVRITVKSRRIGLAIFLLIVFGAPAVLFRFTPSTHFDQRTLDHLQEFQPQSVFLGNSLLETRIDTDYLGELLGGGTALSLAVEGSQSAVWYLQLKNLVTESEVPPHTVFVFFHNDLITAPLWGFDRQDERLINSLMRGDESQFHSVIKSARTPHQQTVASLRSIYPLQRWNLTAHDGLSEVAAALVPRSRDQLSAKADETFSVFPGTDGKPAPTVPERPFSSAVDQSFLPGMIDIARAHGTRLVFVRLQRRPNEDGSSNEPRLMRQYSSNLAAYLEAEDVGYVDLTGNPAIDPALYFDEFHIRRRYLREYTEIFFEHMREFLASPGEQALTGQGP